MSKKSNEYRLRMLRYFKDRYGKAKPAEVLEAEKVIAEFREQEARDREMEARLRLDLPEPDLCPKCFYRHNTLTKLSPVDSPHPNIDYFRCRACGHNHEVRHH